MRRISARGLGKAYRRYRRPLDRALEWAGARERHASFWAVESATFDVEHGESVGLVGDNGAGKTTLLAMLAGLTSPTRGDLAVHGRIGSILELGAGFHGEFTGRENVYLAGQAQGLSRSDVRDRVDRIVDFAELGEFIDEPVRTYSSGMFLRLAFSIATAVDPDVLVVDEALAVGDQHFQAKCAERIDRFVRGGGTLVFCSHNLYQVKKLCQRALWLEHGRVVRYGAADAVCDAYADHSRSREFQGRTGRQEGGAPLVQVTAVEAVDESGEPLQSMRTGDTAVLRIWLRRSPGVDVEPGVAVGVVRADGLVCHCGSTELDGARPRDLGDDRFFVSVRFPDLPLLGGSYHFNVAAMDNRRPLIVLDLKEGEAPFSVVNPGTDWGVCRLPHVWGEDLAPARQQSREEGGRA
jgi:lipopolysaccharide transport system ATP-binding protein